MALGPTCVQAVVAALVIGLVGSACDHTQLPPRDPGDFEAEPLLTSLPELVVGGTADTERTHHGLVTAGKVLDDGLPEAPRARDFGALQVWVDKEVSAWIGRRTLGIKAAQFQFTSITDPTEGEVIVQHAVVGLIHEDTALSLQHMPVPEELNSEPDVAQMYEEIMAKQTVPFMSAALVEFRKCADLAYEGPDDMQHWAMYCAQRFRMLRLSPAYASALQAQRH